MDHHDDPARPGTDTAVHHAFTGIVRALATEDPGFVRGLAWPAPARLGTANLTIMVGLVATVVLGIVPLAVGLHTGLVGLLAVGALATVVVPVAAMWRLRRR